MLDVLRDWPSAFPAFEPVAHRAKVQFADRWVRFHSLPNSKRYPENEIDFAELLTRFNAVLGELVDTQTDLVLLTTDFSDAARLAPTLPPTTKGRHWRTVVVDDFYWHIYAVEVAWRPTAFDSLVREVAMDAASNVMICDPGCRWLLHPYDGGMDAILPDSFARDRLRAKFSTWLPARVDGR